MNYFALAGFVLLTAQAINVIRTFMPSVIEARVARLCEAFGLAVPERLEQFVLHRTAIRYRAAAAGMFVGFGIGLGFVVLIDAEPVESYLAIIAGGIVGSTLALGIVSVVAVGRTASSGIARATAVSIDDYLSPAYRVLTGVGVGIGIVLVAIGAANGAADVAAWASIIAAVLAVVIAEVAGRRLVDLPQSAGTEFELAWNDALRSQVVRDLYSSPLPLTALAVYVMISNVFTSPFLPVLFQAILVTIALISTIVSVRRRSQRYVLRRLWPSIEARRVQN